MVEKPTRRRLLAAGALAAVAGLAGCQDGGGEPTTVRTPTPQPVPIASFDFEYDGEARTLTITHDGGEAVPAAELYVRGSGFADVGGVDMTAPGQWAGQSTDGSVRTGDSVTVGVAADYELRVVWQSQDGDASDVYAEESGPDA